VRKEASTVFTHEYAEEAVQKTVQKAASVLIPEEI
jgi:hypothetical protein